MPKEKNPQWNIPTKIVKNYIITKGNKIRHGAGIKKLKTASLLIKAYLFFFSLQNLYE